MQAFIPAAVEVESTSESMHALHTQLHHRKPDAGRSRPHRRPREHARWIWAFHFAKWRSLDTLYRAEPSSKESTYSFPYRRFGFFSFICWEQILAGNINTCLKSSVLRFFLQNSTQQTQSSTARLLTHLTCSFTTTISLPQSRLNNMAQIYDTSSINQYQVPATPVKGGITVNSTEVGQETSPAPAYNSKYGVVIDDSEVFGKTHPILPGGNVLLDVVTHLSCHKNLNLNIDVLMGQFKQMKADLDAARIGQAKAERALIKEREEKEMWKGQAEALEKALKEALEDLAIVRGDLVATEERLRLSIIQLTDTASKLESARKELRLTVRERDLLARQLANVQRELEFYTARCLELQVALDVANAGENAANDRNTRLTAMLYQIESSKASIERIKDEALARIRELEMTVEELKSGRYGWPEKDAEILRLNLHIANLDVKILQLKDERNAVLAQLEDQKNVNASLNRKVGRLESELKKAKDKRRIYESLYNLFKDIAADLPHKFCRESFPEVEIRREANGTMSIDKMDAFIASVSKGRPADGANAAEGEVKAPEGSGAAGPSTDANKDIVIPPPDEPQVSIPEGENGVPTEGAAEPAKAVEGDTETPARTAQDPLEA